MLTHNPLGNFSFLAAPGRPYSGGVVTDAGFDLVHGSFATPIPLEAGLAAAVRHLATTGRPAQCLAGLELRIPEPLTADDFGKFNARYVASLRGLGLELGGLIPIGRTNVAAVVGAVTEPCLFAFSYATSSSQSKRGFLVSGVAEAEPGDPSAMLGSIMDALSTRLKELGVAWDDVTSIQLYGTETVQALIVDEVLSRTGKAGVRGIRWFPSNPPVVGLRLEIDVQSAGTELVITP